MKKIDKLIAKCDNRAYRIQIGYSLISGIYLEIQKFNKESIFVIDHQKSASKAIKKALKWIKDN